MKQILLALFLVSALAFTAHAQSLRSYGLKTGLTSANARVVYAHRPDIHQVLITDKEGDVRHTGMTVALYGDWNVAGPLSLLTQLEYVQRGFGERVWYGDVMHGEGPFLSVDWTRIDYLSVPVLAKVAFSAASARPYLLIGPRADFLLAHHMDFDSRYYLRLAVNDLERFNMGATFGGGLEVATGLPVSVLLEVRYSHDLVDGNRRGGADRLVFKQNAFDVLVGIKL